jgi:hypothetical protein
VYIHCDTLGGVDSTHLKLVKACLMPALHLLVHASSLPCEPPNQPCVLPIQLCVPSIQPCVPSIQPCVPSIQPCVPSIQPCVPPIQLCVAPRQPGGAPIPAGGGPSTAVCPPPPPQPFASPHCSLHPPFTSVRPLHFLEMLVWKSTLLLPMPYQPTVLSRDKT